MDYDWPLLVIFLLGVLVIAFVLQVLRRVFDLVITTYLRLRIFRASRRLNGWKGNVTTAAAGSDRA